MWLLYHQETINVFWLSISEKSVKHENIGDLEKNGFQLQKVSQKADTKVTPSNGWWSYLNNIFKSLLQKREKIQMS